MQDLTKQSDMICERPKSVGCGGDKSVAQGDQWHFSHPSESGVIDLHATMLKTISIHLFFFSSKPNLIDFCRFETGTVQFNLCVSINWSVVQFYHVHVWLPSSCAWAWQYLWPMALPVTCFSLIPCCSVQSLE